MALHRLFVWLSAVTLLGASFVAGQQPVVQSTPAVALAKPDARDRLIVQSVAQLIEEAHLTRHKLDNEISRRMHKLFLEQWDLKKLFFLESDIAEFAAFETKHAKLLADNDLSFPVTVYERFLKRVTERNEWAQALALEKFDFAKDDTVVLDNKSTRYAKTTDEAKARWRSWIKYELCGMIVNGVKEEEARERIQKRYRNILRITKQTDKDELLERYLSAMASSFDPHSTYMSPRTMEDFEIAMRLQLQGIGAVLSGEDGKIIVKEVIGGGAADLDKRLKIGDQITGVGEGDNGDLVDVSDMSLNHAVRLIRGKAGTRVKLEVIPAKSDQRSVYVLTRRKIDLTERAAKGDIVETPGAGPNAPKVRVGVIKLPSFYGGSGAADTGVSSDVHKILNDFKKKGVDAVVVDLRYNGGGLLSEAIGLASLFVDEGPIVQVKDFEGKVRQHLDDFPGVAYDGPLVVLMNRLSASASEIFTGVIKDYKRGLVVGDSSTFGKGTVAQVVDLARVVQSDTPGKGKYGALQITLQGFYRVNGESTQKRGVKADVVLPSPTDSDDFSELRLDYVLDLDKIPSSKFAAANAVGRDLVQKVLDASKERRSKSEDFAKLEKRVTRLRELLARKTVTFTEASLKQQKSERKELAEIEVNDTNPETKKTETRFGETVYEREVLSITADLARLTKR